MGRERVEYYRTRAYANDTILDERVFDVALLLRSNVHLGEAIKKAVFKKAPTATEYSLEPVSLREGRQKLSEGKVNILMICDSKSHHLDETGNLVEYVQSEILVCPSQEDLISDVPVSGVESNRVAA